MTNDLISRQAAIDEVIAWLRDRMENNKNGKPLTDRLRELPSAQPEHPSRALIEQIRWERDLAIGQLEELGYGLGEKIQTQSERKRGRWTLKENVFGVAYCSECDYELHTNDTNFCPNCGADMREGDDDDGK